MILKFTSLNRTALFSPDRQTRKRSWYSSMMAVAVFLFFGGQVGFCQMPPVFDTCPAAASVTLPAGNGGLTLNNSNIPSLLGVTAVDPNGAETITYSASPSVITCADIGPGFSIAVTATDSDGSDVCNITVDVFDGGPFASCNDITVTLDAAGMFTLTPAEEMALSMGSNACTGITSITVAPNTFDCTDIGAQVVTLTVTDLSGNSSTCMTTVTIEDNMAPEFVVSSLPTPTVSFECGDAGISTVPPTPMATDNCNTPNVQFTDSSTQTGNPNNCGNYTYTIVRTWTASDDSGNLATTTQTVNVADTQGPTYVTFSATGPNGPLTNGGSTTTDASQCFATATVAVDSLTDCASISVIDFAYEVYETSGMTPVFLTSGTGSSVSTTFPTGSYSVDFEMTDPCGNASTESFAFTVDDGSAPVASCVNSLNLGLPASGILVLSPMAVNNNSFDNCTPQNMLNLSITPDTFTCDHVGIGPIEVELFVSDGSLSSSCTTTVTIQDNNDPTAVCQDINISLDANGMATITAADVDGGSSDDCALAASPFSVSQTTFTEANIGTTSVTLTVTDASGNTSSCDANVIIDYPPTCFTFGRTPAGATVAGGVGDIVEFPVFVTDFMNVSSFQFTMGSVNTDVTEFVDVVRVNPVLEPVGFNFFSDLVQTDEDIDMIDTTFIPNWNMTTMDSIGTIDTTFTPFYDQLSVTWQNPTPQTIADNDTAFIVRILLTGNLGESSLVEDQVAVNNGSTAEISYNFNNINSPNLPLTCINPATVVIINLEIAGQIYDASNAPANEVFVELYDTGILDQTDQTMTDGAFSFQVSNNGPFEIRPYKYTTWFNGVTASDVSDIQRHAIGIGNFDFGTSYKEIAADMNNDLVVSTFDALLLNQYVASAYTLPPPAGIPSWRFVPAEDVLAYSSDINITPYDTTIFINNLITDSLSNDFIAIKMGDVTGDANPQSIMDDSADPFGDDNVHFQIKDQSFEAGDLVTVELSADQFEDLKAYQWILQFDQNVLNFADVKMGTLPALGMKNFGLNLLEEGKIVMTWFTTEAESKRADELLYSFTFEASRDGQLSELLTVGQVENFRSEAYDITNGDSRAIDLRFTDKDQELVTNFALMQNSPNPFKDQTSIGFFLPEAATATLSLMDVSGRLLKTIEIEANEGYNAITIEKDELPAAGVVHYQLETPTHSAVKKMVILD